MADALPDYDVAVVGAGINGAGIARDAALRGLRVVLLEKNDICTGTSWISSRLIHGGLRYLQYAELSLVYESLHERRTLRKIAPHLIKPLRLSLPIYKGARRGPLLIKLGMLLYDLLSRGKRLPGHDMLSRDEIIDAEPGLNTVGLRAAARYFDTQVSFAERLVLENVIAAKAAGADVLTYSEVTAIEAGDRNTITYVDRLSGDLSRVRAKILVNAAGPWIDLVLATTGCPATDLIGGTKGSHIIVRPFAGAPNDALYVEAKSDGRPFFIIPWNDQYLIGTTDIRCDEDLDSIRASGPEIDYLLTETNRVCPAAKLGRSDIHYAYAGVRALPRQTTGPESAITRKHIILVNADIGPGIISIIGGKLTTYRHMAEQTVDKIGKLLRRRLPDCRTKETLLPGAYALEEARAAMGESGLLSDRGCDRVMSIYGGRTLRLLDLAEADAALGETLDADRTVLAAEVAMAAREEMARTLADIVFRRTMLGLRADQGRPCYEALADLAASELGWDDERRAQELAELTAYSDSLRV